jgi:hypothetical protein
MVEARLTLLDGGDKGRFKANARLSAQREKSSKVVETLGLYALYCFSTARVSTSVQPELHPGLPSPPCYLTSSSPHILRPQLPQSLRSVQFHATRQAIMVSAAGVFYKIVKGTFLPFSFLNPIE